MSIPSTPQFTDKQGQYLAFIHLYTKLNRRPPAQADIQRYFQVTPPSVHSMIVTLEKLGLIRRQAGHARAIEVLVDPANLPVLR
jgi:Mn-dependent DtxR family transcriptional regulator